MNKPVSNKTLLQQLEWRYATKKFDVTKKLSNEDWNTLAEALRLAPSSYGLQPWKAIVVQNPDLRKKLRAASWNQPQIEEASHLVVFTSLKKINESYVQKFIARIAEVRGQSVAALKNHQDMMDSDVTQGAISKNAPCWAQRQAYIAIGILLETAALLGVDACPMEGIDPVKYDQLLQLNISDYSAVAVVTLGYRSAEDSHQHAKKVRFEASDLIQVID